LELGICPPLGTARARGRKSSCSARTAVTFFRVLRDVCSIPVRHYQFEAIHPFSNGNGRTGGILNVLMLVDAGLLRLPVLYLSRYIVDTKSDYYRLLLAVTAEWRVPAE
jgi:hypothetical protein